MAICDHALVLLEGLGEAVFELGVVGIDLVDELHLCGSQLFAPLLELVLDLSLDLLLSLLKEAIMTLVALARLHVNALLMNGLIHVH